MLSPDICKSSQRLGAFSVVRQQHVPAAAGRELVREREVRAAFLRSPLVELSAFAAFHFLELLVGPKAAGLRVKDPAKLGALQTMSARHSLELVSSSPDTHSSNVVWVHGARQHAGDDIEHAYLSSVSVGPAQPRALVRIVSFAVSIAGMA